MARETHCEQTAWSCRAGRALAFGVTGKACRTDSAVGQTPLQGGGLSVLHIGERLASVCSHHMAARPACYACAGQQQVICRQAQEAAVAAPQRSKARSMGPPAKRFGGKMGMHSNERPSPAGSCALWLCFCCWRLLNVKRARQGRDAASLMHVVPAATCCCRTSCTKSKFSCRAYWLL